MLGPPGAPVATHWVTYPGLYTATCKSAGGDTWLQVTDIGAAADTRPRVTEQDGASWGFHVADVNLALGNLVDDVQAAGDRLPRRAAGSRRYPAAVAERGGGNSREQIRRVDLEERPPGRAGRETASRPMPVRPTPSVERVGDRRVHRGREHDLAAVRREAPMRAAACTERPT